MATQYTFILTKRDNEQTGQEEWAIDYPNGFPIELEQNLARYWSTMYPYRPIVDWVDTGERDVNGRIVYTNGQTKFILRQIMQDCEPRREYYGFALPGYGILVRTEISTDYEVGAIDERKKFEWHEVNWFDGTDFTGHTVKIENGVHFTLAYKSPVTDVEGDDYYLTPDGVAFRLRYQRNQGQVISTALIECRTENEPEWLVFDWYPSGAESLGGDNIPLLKWASKRWYYGSQGCDWHIRFQYQLTGLRVQRRSGKNLRWQEVYRAKDGQLFIMFQKPGSPEFVGRFGFSVVPAKDCVHIDQLDSVIAENREKEYPVYS